MKSKRTANPLTETLLIRLTREERKALQTAAQHEQRSMAAQLRVFLNRGLQQQQAA